MARLVNAPCYGCENRLLGCHSKCKRYNNYRQLLSEQRAIDRTFRAEKHALDTLELTKGKRKKKQ